jgi:glycosyltransferase involved in cell wall biosynthesis
VDRLTPSVSVIIPAHNEAPTIASIVRLTSSAVPDAEILVVDDGSEDGTADAAAQAGARVIRLAVNEGKGAALQRGIRESTGEFLVFIDGDGQDSPAEIPLLIGAFAPGVDLVLGSRFLGKFRPGAITRLNLAGTHLITWLVKVTFGSRVTDPLAGFRAVRRSIFERIELRATGYDIEVDLLLRVLRAGGRVVEVPASRSARPFGTSDLSSLTDGIRIARRIFQVRFERAMVSKIPSTPSVESVAIVQNEVP